MMPLLIAGEHLNISLCVSVRACVCLLHRSWTHTHTQSFSSHAPNTDGISLISSKGENMQTKGKGARSGGLVQRMAVIEFVWRVRQTSQHVVTYVFLFILLKSIDKDI